MNWVKKEVKKARELENISLLISLDINVIPEIKNISKKSYLIRKGCQLAPHDFSPSNFLRLCRNLLIPLYKHKQRNFTPGIYKYFLPSNIDSTVSSGNYITYITREFERIAKKTLIKSCSDSNPSMLLWYLKSLRRMKSDLTMQNWIPPRGFSLLHGDLHTANIIKNNGKYLLIDFEYLRYGPPELEVSNLAYSALLRFRQRGWSRGDVYDMFNIYKRNIDKLSFVDSEALPFFLLFSSSLFYLGAYLKRDLDSLSLFKEIVNCSGFPCKGGVKDGN